VPQGEAKRRLFTIDEARALVKAITPEVERLLGLFGEIRAAIEEASQRSGHKLDSPELGSLLESEGKVPALFRAVHDLLQLIQSHGCLVNGPDAGLVDFPCLYNNEVVFLCWKYGEPGIGHWHKVGEGFAGRRPLLDDAPDETATAVH
jgi:hypothetical protein